MIHSRLSKPSSLRRRLRKFRRMTRESEHLDRWMVSYADFITLLFALFVVMYAVSRVNEGQYRVVSEALMAAFQKDLPPHIAPKYAQGKAISILDGAIKSREGGSPTIEQKRVLAEHEQRVQQLKAVADALGNAVQSLMEQGQVSLTQNESGITVDISASALFKSGQAALEAEVLPSLRAVGQVLAKIQNTVEIQGHTDVLPIATAAYPSNWELSGARAASVVRFFVEQGVPGERLAAAGFGEFRPIDSNNTVEGRSHNRRVTIIIQATQSKEALPK